MVLEHEEQAISNLYKIKGALKMIEGTSFATEILTNQVRGIIKELQELEGIAESIVSSYTKKEEVND